MKLPDKPDGKLTGERGAAAPRCHGCHHPRRSSSRPMDGAMQGRLRIRRLGRLRPLPFQPPVLQPRQRDHNGVEGCQRDHAEPVCQSRSTPDETCSGLMRVARIDTVGRRGAEPRLSLDGPGVVTAVTAETACPRRYTGPCMIGRYRTRGASRARQAARRRVQLPRTRFLQRIRRRRSRSTAPLTNSPPRWAEGAGATGDAAAVVLASEAWPGTTPVPHPVHCATSPTANFSALVAPFETEAPRGPRP